LVGVEDRGLPQADISTTDSAKERLVTLEIGSRKFRFSTSDARLAVGGYAFGTRVIEPDRTMAGAFKPELAPRWGYRTYDCVPASADDDFSDLDILVAAGLNGQLDISAVGALQVAVQRAAPWLAEAACAGTDFADLPRGELADDAPRGTVGWSLTEAWRQMMATPDVGIALTHKVLHHKRPALFPLLDNLTAAKVSPAPEGRNAWQQIHIEISNARDAFEELRSWFEAEATARSGDPLSLPRLHDILLWLHAKGQWRDALAAGRAALSDWAMG
jgi:hypothetical protein